MVIHSDRKPPDRRFLDSASDPRNDGAAWQHSVSHQQERIRQGFLVEMTQGLITPIGNDSPMVSCCDDTH